MGIYSYNLVLPTQKWVLSTVHGCIPKTGPTLFAPRRPRSHCWMPVGCLVAPPYSPGNEPELAR